MLSTRQFDAEVSHFEKFMLRRGKKYPCCDAARDQCVRSPVDDGPGGSPALDRERGRLVTGAPRPPHAGIGRLDALGKSVGVEQRGPIAISLQPLAHLDQPLRSACELERQLFIFRERARDSTPAGRSRSAGSRRPGPQTYLRRRSEPGVRSKAHHWRSCAHCKARCRETDRPAGDGPDARRFDGFLQELLARHRYAHGRYGSR
jgi:hypothetical protein